MITIEMYVKKDDTHKNPEANEMCEKQPNSIWPQKNKSGPSKLSLVLNHENEPQR